MELPIDEPPSQFVLANILTPDFFYYVLNGILFVAFLVSSALISGSEVAFFSLSPQQLDQCKNSLNNKEQVIAQLLLHPKRLLATILILNNLVNISIVTLSTFMMWRAMETSSSEGIAIAILTSIITLLIVFFGEVIPKVYATQNNMKLAKITAQSLRIFQKIFTPISSPLLSMSNFVEKRIQRKGYELSVDQLQQAVDLTTSNAETTTEERDILKGIVNFGTFTVKQVMRSRLDIVAIDSQINFHELMNLINKTGFSRIPVFTDTIDNIDGVLYVKDVLPHIDNGEDFQWAELLRPAFFVPETKKIDSLLKDFQEKRVHIAIIVDEYGGTSGLITLEDIIEEIVGEINDEFDGDQQLYTTVNPNTYIFEAKTSLNDFCKVVNADPSSFDSVKGESESLGGLILELNAVIPNTGEKISYQQYTFTVTAVDNKRIKKVKVHINSP